MKEKIQYDDNLEAHKARQRELQKQQILREIAQKHKEDVIRCLEAERLRKQHY